MGIWASLLLLLLPLLQAVRPIAKAEIKDARSSTDGGIEAIDALSIYY
jgi:hypothetical protein